MKRTAVVLESVNVSVSELRAVYRQLCSATACLLGQLSRTEHS